MKFPKAILAALLAAIVLTGCGDPDIVLTPQKTEDTSQTGGQATVDSASLFTDRDRSGDYSQSDARQILLSGNTASSTAASVKITGSTVTVTEEGVYILTGTLEDGMVIVEADKTEKVQLVLAGVSIHSETSAAVYVRQADKVFVTLAPGTENTLSNGGSFVAIDENNIDSVIFSKDDLTLNGSGSLTVESPAGHGVVSKDDLTVAGGSYSLTCASHGFTANDLLAVTEASVTVVSGKDGLHAENNEDTALGNLVVESGSFHITAQGDGISAGGTLQIIDGSFTVVSGGGSANAAEKTADQFGGGRGGMGPGSMGGGRPGGGGFGGFGGEPESSAEEDTGSAKGIKSTGDMLLLGGTFAIDSADDAIHSNANITFCGGSYELSTGDDGVHADEKLILSGGRVIVSESYEGLEGLSVEITGGDVTLVSSDDGLNAAGGTDQSGFGGFHGSDRFGSGGSSDSYVRISGGSITLRSSGDGIDSNGSLEITGGTVTVCGPTQGDTAVLDYDTTGTISGGIFIGTGSYMMAQSLSSSGEQGVIALSVGNQSAGTEIILTDSGGNVILSHTPERDFAIVILSSPNIRVGESYTVTIGSASGTFEAG